MRNRVWFLVSLIYALALFSLFSVHAQEEYRFRNFNKEDGISQSSIFTITQDATGFLWFGTRDGLNRYDGYNFTIFRTREGLINNDVRAIYHDSITNQLWVGALGGLSRYDIKLDQFTGYRYGDGKGLLSDNVSSITKTKSGAILIGTAGGVNVYDPNTDQLKPLHSGSSQLDVRDILISSSGVIYLATKTGVYLQEGLQANPTLISISHLAGAKDSPISCLLEAQDGSIWIGTQGNGAIHWHPKRGTIKHLKSNENAPNSLNHNEVRSIVETKDGAIWVGTFRGLNRIAAGEDCCEAMSEADTSTENITTGSIHSLHVDSRGALWVGSYHGGLSYYAPGLNQFKNIYHRPLQNSLSNDVVSSFQEDEQNNLWIGTEGGGLNYFNRKTGKFSVYTHRDKVTNTLTGNNIKTLLLDNGNLWIGTYARGLDLFNPETASFTHFRHDPQDPQTISNNSVYDLLKQGDSLWIATFGGGLDLYDSKNGGFNHFRASEADSNSLCSDLIRVIVRDPKGLLWIGTHHGLSRMSPEKNSVSDNSYRFQSYLKEQAVYSLYPAEDGKIWVGTYSNGLFCLNPEKNEVEHFTLENGLPGNSVFGILSDSTGYLWLSTDNGIARLNTSNHRITSYNQSHGLRALEYNFNAYERLRNGEILFGGVRGFTLFNPLAITSNTYSPPVAFTGLSQFNQPVKVNAEGVLKNQLDQTTALEFPYNEANFSIAFTALDYFNPAYNEYRYKLEGLDQNWTTNRGKTIANYSIQRPGQYTFRLRAANSEGIWNPTERTIEITVHPPPWKSWWAYLLYSLLFLAGIYATYHFLKLRQQYKFEQLANTQRDQLNKAKLRFFTNVAHEFRTPLTLILGPLEEILSRDSFTSETGKKLRVVKQSAGRLLDLVNQLLTFRKLEAEGEQLAAGPGNIVKFCQEIFLSFTEHARLKNVNFSFDFSDSYIELFYDRDKLEKVLVNLLANAFKFTPDGESIEMSVATEGSKVLIKVKDTGVGIAQDLHEQIFKRFYEKEGDVRNVIKGSGIGLALSREMVNLHQGTIEVQSEVGKGSVFAISLPLGKEHLRPNDIISNFKDSEQIDHYRFPDERKEVSAQVMDEEKEIFAPLKSAGQLPKLLIVEDNPAVREYIEECFEGLFSIKKAENGVLGLKSAITNIPDLIISDVMMPEMDGISLCRELKKDERTNHIPIILLTARTAATFKLEGLEMGADDYVTKPFSPKELRLRVRNILSSRLKIRNKLVRLGILEPKEIQLSSIEEIFLEKAMALVEKNIDQPDFNVEKFAREMAVSRAFLFAKLKAVTDHTPNNFVKTIRLKRAAQLLKEYNLEVAQVAYKVGFRDPRYFSKCFKKMYAVSPSEYHNKEGKQNALAKG